MPVVNAVAALVPVANHIWSHNSGAYKFMDVPGATTVGFVRNSWLSFAEKSATLVQEKLVEPTVITLFPSPGLVT